jgi:protein subunit release factor A
MRRLTDFVLITGLLLAIGGGAYFIGSRVDHESDKLASQDSELNQTTSAATPTKKASNNHTVVYVAIGVGGVAAALFLTSLAGSFVRARKRERWHAT